MIKIGSVSDLYESASGCNYSIRDHLFFCVDSYMMPGVMSFLMVDNICSTIGESLDEDEQQNQEFTIV